MYEDVSNAIGDFEDWEEQVLSLPGVRTAFEKAVLLRGAKEGENRTDFNIFRRRDEYLTLMNRFSDDVDVDEAQGLIDELRREAGFEDESAFIAALSNPEEAGLAAEDLLAVSSLIAQFTEMVSDVSMSDAEISVLEAAQTAEENRLSVLEELQEMFSRCPKTETAEELGHILCQNLTPPQYH